MTPFDKPINSNPGLGQPSVVNLSPQITLGAANRHSGVQNGPDIDAHGKPDPSIGAKESALAGIHARTKVMDIHNNGKGRNFEPLPMLGPSTLNGQIVRKAGGTVLRERASSMASRITRASQHMLRAALGH